MFDAYVRIRLDALKAIVPSHLQSGVDLDPEPSRLDAVAAVTGFTEWVADASRTLSLGWDWSFDPLTRQLLANWQTLRTNVMLVGDDGADLGREQTRRDIAQWMASTNWQGTTASACGLPALQGN